MEAELIERMGDIADAALTRYHHVGYAERINIMWEALQQISAERIEYINNKEAVDETAHQTA